LNSSRTLQYPVNNVWFAFHISAQRSKTVGIRMISMAQHHDPNNDESTVLERQEQRVEPPPMFQVLLLNDDYTPMEFVVLVLQQFFGKGREQATQIMLKVHREGKGVCGVYPQDIAATKVDQVTEFARQHQHPLQCVLEKT
jgi:ATP-dependent Clp protease adaptor protein ClpS